VTVDPEDDDLIDQTLAHYRVIAALGAGGMGEGYRATDLQALGVGNIYAVAPGAARFLMLAEDSGQTAGRLVLVQNWLEEFRGKR
jgi:hypothetical protein